MTLGDFIRILISILIPPLGVFLRVGFGLHFWLNILLTLLGYIPGLIHAIWIIASHRTRDDLTYGGKYLK